jgi:hypothetical protein
LIAGIAVGALGGYLYYYYIGCMSGSCPITSRPLNSTLYGALMGALLFGNFGQKKTETDNQNQITKQ